MNSEVLLKVDLDMDWVANFDPECVVCLFHSSLLIFF